MFYGAMEHFRHIGYIADIPILNRLIKLDSCLNIPDILVTLLTFQLSIGKLKADERNI